MMMAAENGSASVISDDHLKKLVDSCKRNKQDRSLTELAKDREGRVFVNRSISMDKIKYIGFDMDHTLVVYRSPEYDKLAYQLAVQRLVSIGYPRSIEKIVYDEVFALRGLFFDRRYGNILKLDSFGNILSCYHGFSALSVSEIRSYYPNKYVQVNHDRLFSLETLFHTPETFLLSALVHFFDAHPQYTRIKEGPDQYTGVKNGDVIITYRMIQQDVRTAIDWAHIEGDLKKLTLENLPLYVKRDPRLPRCIERLRQSGKKLFIATNSGYEYTSKIMSYLFQLPDVTREWKTYFDYIIVDAKKPLFFQEGSMLREVDESTGSLRLGRFAGELTPGKVFSGGSSDAFCKIAGAQGKEVLYVGDHIFGDIIKSKKEQAFRTFLVIPELITEITTFENAKGLLTRIQNLEFLLSEMYHDERSSVKESVQDLPSIDAIRTAIRDTSQLIEDSYPHSLGSLLRCGSRLTYFANQVSRFADLYSSSCVNLVNYPDHYLFSSPHQLMAHETASTEEEDSSVSPKLLGSGFNHKKKRNIKRNVSATVGLDLDIEDDDIDGFISNDKN